MSSYKSSQEQGVSPGAPLPSSRQYGPSASSSRRASPSSTDGHRTMPRVVSAVPSSVLVPLSMPAPGPVCSAAGANFVVSPELMAAMESKPLLIPDLPPSCNEVSVLLIHWAIEGHEGCFHLAEAVVRTSGLRKHLPMSNEE